MSDTLPALTDRWTAALAAHGVRLRRSKVTELMATLLGHRSSNELVAAAARGDLDPPKAVSGDGVADGDLVTLRDPVSSGTFAVPRAMLEASDRAMAYLWSPSGNLLDVHDAKRSLAGRDAPLAAIHEPRAVIPRIDLHALVRQCDAAGAESVDIRSDGNSGQVTSTMPDGTVTTHYDHVAMPVLALLHALIDRRAPVDESMRDPLSVDGADLEVDASERMGIDYVRLHLAAGRRRRTLHLRAVLFTDLECELIDVASCWADGHTGDVAGRLARDGAAALGDGHLAMPPEASPDAGEGRYRNVRLDPGMNDVVNALSARTGHHVDDVIRALVVMALPGDEGVALFRASEAATLWVPGASGAAAEPLHDAVVPVTQVPQVMRSVPFSRSEWARVDAVSFRRRQLVVGTVLTLVVAGLETAVETRPWPTVDHDGFQRVYLDDAVDGAVVTLAGRIGQPVADTVRWLVLAGLDQAEEGLAGEGWLSLP